LEALHESVQQLRERAGRPADDLNLMLFETALAEIGSNVLVHGLPADRPLSVEYRLEWDGSSAVAWLTGQGPPVHNHLTRAMPSRTQERGRGLAIAGRILDELTYQREGKVNTWRLVKRL
jgi:serine/threonine-protein kinase RsbW